MHPIARRWPALCAVLFLAAAVLLPAHTARAAAQAIYDDTLATGWSNWSWATVDVANTATTRGSASIKVTYGPFQGLYLHHAGVSTSGFTTLRFWLNGGTSGGQQLKLCASAACATVPSFTVTAKANTWTQVDVPLSALGNPATITDLVWQEAAGTSDQPAFLDDIALVANSDPNAPAITAGGVLPSALPADGSQAVVNARVSDPQGASDIDTVTVDATALGAGTLTLRDDGRSGDGSAGDGVYGSALRVASGTPSGEYMLTATARDKGGQSSTGPLGAFVVLAAPGGKIPSVLPQRLGWGTNEFDANSQNNWQVKSGVPWDYNYRYITYEWYTDASRWGNYVGQVTKNAWANNYVPVISVYMMLGVGSNTGEGGASYATKLQNANIVRDYLAALKQAALDAKGDKPVIFQLEPDFYGFMQQLSNDAAKRPAGVKPNDPTSFTVALNVDGYPNTLAGFGQRMIDVVKQNAPNALVGPHASYWAINGDPNSGTPADTIAAARSTAQFINAMGGDKADLLFVEWSDRDAGSGLRPLWDASNRTLPRFSRVTLWQNALSNAAGKRLALWQVPAGNENQNNTCDHYKDNKSAYAFSHQRDLIGAGVIAVMFGAGAGCMTSAATDGGYIAAQAALAYAAPATPGGLQALGTNGASVSFSWAANSEADLAGYRLSYTGPAGSSGQALTGPLNSGTLLLPRKGNYRITVAAIDAQGNASAESPPIDATSNADARLVFLPVVRR